MKEEISDKWKRDCKRHEHGLCIRCQKPIKTSSWFCEDCAALRAADKRETYRFWRDHQRCVICHEQDALTMNNHAYCSGCREKRRAYSCEYRRKHKEESNKYDKERKQRLKENGPCIQCGKPSKTGASRCALCAEKESRKRKEKIAKLSTINYPRGENGICWQCNKNQAIDGKRVCQTCYEKILYRVKNRGNWETHPWRIDRMLTLPTVYKWLNEVCPRI